MGSDLNRLKSFFTRKRQEPVDIKEDVMEAVQENTVEEDPIAVANAKIDDLFAAYGRVAQKLADRGDALNSALRHANKGINHVYKVLDQIALRRNDPDFHN